MSQWIRNEEVTRRMRADPDCPADACVYDKPPLRAFVMYADVEIFPGLRWHVVVASADGQPTWTEARAAWMALLPGIYPICYLPTEDTAGDNAIHICEIGEQRRLQ